MTLDEIKNHMYKYMVDGVQTVFKFRLYEWI